MTVSKTVSTGGAWMTLAGTYAEVINQLEADKVPGNQVISFAYTSTGACIVLIHKH